MGKYDDDPVPYTKDFIRLLKERSPRIAMAVAAIEAAQPGIRYARATYRTHKIFTIKVPGGLGSDGLYDELHEWVLSLLPSSKRRALVAYIRSGRGVARDWDSDFAYRDAPPVSRLRLRYDGTRVQYVTVRGHRIKVSAQDSNTLGKKAAFPEIIFSMTTEKARDDLILEIEKILAESAGKSRTPMFRMLNSFDDWETVEDLQPRPLESVILAEGQLERIVADIQRFRDEEEAYIRRCIPYHRAHLYTGKPGTGKTSTVRALASHFGMDAWYLPLSDVKKDSSLVRMITNIRSNSILLLEDIDIYHAATSADDDGGSTLSGLLNSLDGLATPHGLVTVMTANKPEKLQEALTRKGRGADLTEHFGLSGAAEAARLVSRWYHEPCPPLKKSLRLSASDISEICKGADSARAAAEVLNGETPE